MLNTLHWMKQQAMQLNKIIVQFDVSPAPIALSLSSSIYEKLIKE